MRIAGALILLLAATAIWGGQRMTTVRLHSELEARRATLAERETLRREQERLRALEPDAATWHELQRRKTEHVALQAELARRERELSRPIAGEAWLPFQQWQNRGQATSLDTIETTLWAAAGGDVSRLADLLHLTPALREKVATVLAVLPPELRGRYARAEQLVAEFTAKAIPLGKARLTWLRETSADEAIACVRLNPAAGPTNVDDTWYHSAYLSLRREGGDWRLVVPAAEIARIERELTGVAAK